MKVYESGINPSKIAFFNARHMGVSKNNGTPKSSILIGFSIIFTIHFGVPLFLETSIFPHTLKNTEAAWSSQHVNLEMAIVMGIYGTPPMLPPPRNKALIRPN